MFVAQGIEILGHRAALWEATRVTLDLIAEHGLACDSSLMGDDRPYVLDVADRSIVELPVYWSLDDWEPAYLPSPQIGSVIESPRKVLELWTAELDAMRHYRCLFNLCLHPFLSGRPSRLLALRSLIEYAQASGGITFARCRDLADATHSDPSLQPRKPPTVSADPAVYPD
ncbi:hypothetical protein AB0E63_34270 [Kribbella sp. NPDC026596]|uniref:hypothetical protein n=1 Tax=Kribbella sp. NPDC026596 TaxID=3155122 RepID=UPI0033FD61FC